MALDFSFGAETPITLQSVFGAAGNVGADQSFITPRTSDTVALDAGQSMTPIDNSGGGAWGDFWKDTLRSVVGYAIAKDAQQSGVVPMSPTQVQQQQQQQAAAAATRLPGWLVPAAMVGGAAVLFLALRK